MLNTKKKLTFLKTSMSIASWTMISRLLGFMRDLIFANFFGAGAVLDAFLIAFKIPNYMRRFFSEGALTQAFVPTYTHLLNTNEKKAGAIASQTAILLGLFLSFLTMIVVAKPRWFIQLFAWGLIYDPMRFNLACQMIQWTFPFLLLIALTTLFSGILNSHNQFKLPAALPIALNISLMTAVLLPIHSISPGLKIAMAVTIAGLIQVSIASLAAFKYLTWIDQWDWAVLKRIFYGMGVIISGAVFSQINSIFDTVFASFLPRGSISWLYYADRLINLPIGVIAVSISTLLLPKLSNAITSKKTTNIQTQIDWGIQIIFAGLIPCITMLAFYGKQIIICLFYHGAFELIDIQMTYLALSAFAFGLPAMMLNKLMNTVFYAHQQIKQPTTIACLCALFSICLNLMLVPIFEHVGLALTTSATAWLQCATLFYLANKRGWLNWESKLYFKWLSSLILSAVCLALIKYLLPHTQWWLTHSSSMRFELLLFISVLFLSIYVFQLKFIGLSKNLKL